MTEPKKPKVTVDVVEAPIHLDDQTIAKLAEPAPPRTERRVSVPIIAKAADEHTTVSTIETISTPHAQSEETLTTESQRHVNLIWERTQQGIALAVTWIALFVASWLSIRGEDDSKTAAFVFLYGVANLVIGFYFGRTNHQRTGGIQQGR